MQVLDVSRDANQDEIKKAFRKQALKLHPDKVHWLRLLAFVISIFVGRVFVASYCLLTRLHTLARI